MGGRGGGGQEDIRLACFREEKERKMSTPKSIYFEAYNKDMFSIDAKISESSSKYDEEK